MAQSMPSFSTMLRKENHKPPSSLPSTLEMDSPAKCWSKANGVLSNSRGSKLVAQGRRGLMARKSYVSMEELKGLSIRFHTCVHDLSHNLKYIEDIPDVIFLEYTISELIQSQQQQYEQKTRTT
ncbi:hypothetical protein CerSpe_238090 [Prunus speciosa]